MPDPFNQDTMNSLMGYLPPRMQAMARGGYGAAQHALGLPQRMIESAGQMAQGGGYDPAPFGDFMMGAATGMPGAGAGTLGAFGGGWKGAGRPQVTLQREGNPRHISDFNQGLTAHKFNILDTEGNPLGSMSGVHTAAGASYEGSPSSFYVSGIRSNVPGENWASPRVLGTPAVRSMVKALQDHFPDLEEIRGTRISGARKAAGVVSGGEGMRSPINPSTGHYYSDAAMKLPKRKPE